MRRLFVAAGVLVLMGGCWSSPRGPDADGGAQVTSDGRLRFWLGAQCPGVATVRVLLEDPDDRLIGEWSASADDAGGSPLTRIEVGTVPAGFTETSPLDTPWQDADVVSFRFLGPDGDSIARDFVVVDSLLDDAEDHPGEWFLQDRGWYSEDEYRALADDDMIYPFCELPGR